MMERAVTEPRHLDIEVPFVGGGRAILRIPRHMTEQDYDLLTKMLRFFFDAMKPAFVQPEGDKPLTRGLAES